MTQVRFAGLSKDFTCVSKTHVLALQEVVGQRGFLVLISSRDGADLMFSGAQGAGHFIALGSLLDLIKKAHVTLTSGSISLEVSDGKLHAYATLSNGEQVPFSVANLVALSRYLDLPIEVNDGLLTWEQVPNVERAICLYSTEVNKLISPAMLGYVILPPQTVGYIH